MTRIFKHFAAFAAMALFLVPAFAHAVTFTNASLKGRYSVLIDAWTPDASVTQSAVLALATFDGAGNVTANSVLLQGPASGTSTTDNVVLTGTYSVNADGSGNIAFTGGDNVAFRLDASAGGVARGAQLLLVTPNPDASVNSGVAVQQSPLPKNFTPASLKGTFSYLQNRWTATIATKAGAFVGILKFDGKGNVTNDSVGMIGSTGPIPSSVSGTYTVNADGTGSISYTNGASFAFVITANGKEIQSVLTTPHNPGNFLISQTALKQ
jgi:hypothetical protein